MCEDLHTVSMVGTLLNYRPVNGFPNGFRQVHQWEKWSASNPVVWFISMREFTINPNSFFWFFLGGGQDKPCDENLVKRTHVRTIIILLNKTNISVWYYISNDKVPKFQFRIFFLPIRGLKWEMASLAHP